MVILSIIALFLGVLYGLIGFDIELINYITNNVDYILYLLMFLVGISVGLNRGIVNKIKEYHIKIFIIPFGTIVGSILGGVICSFISAYAINECTAVASGLGWYSLSGVAVSKLAGAKLGSITFLSNLMREIFSFFCIPWI
ncbi:MAG: lysine exporter LysO family protein, partial [Lachnospiraceae bacterium]